LRLLVALSALMLAVGLCTLLLWRWGRSREPSPCDAREIEEIASPGGRAQADVFEVRCPGAVTTHVALRAADKPPESRADVFVGLGAVPVRVVWSGDREILIESMAARLLVGETRWREVSVRIRREK